MLNGRKTIGIILFDITGYYQQQLVHTLSKTASKCGYNLLTFSAFDPLMNNMFNETFGPLEGGVEL